MDRIIENVAKEYGVSPDECREQIRNALLIAGIELEPEQVILLSAARTLTLLVPEVAPRAAAAGGTED